MLIGACMEALGVGLILPLLQVITDEQRLTNPGLLHELYSMSTASSPEEFVLICLAAIGFVYIVKTLLTFLITHRSYTTIYGASGRLSTYLYANYLRSPYSFHLKTNSATLVRNIIHLPVDVCGSLLNPIIVLATECLVIVAIGGVLLVAQPAATIGAGFSLTIVAGTYFLLIRRRLQNWGSAVVGLARDRILWTNQGMAAIKEIKLAGAEDFVTNRYGSINKHWAQIKTLSSFVGDSPRPALELMVMLLVLGGCAALIQNGYRVADLVSVVGLFGIAAMRLLPSLSKITFNLGNLKLNAAALDELMHDIKMFRSSEHEEISDDGSAIPFSKELRLDRIGFSYPNSTVASLRNISCAIPHGATVAFVGSSGAGKTTLTAIVTGLLAPSEGRILADGKEIDCRGRKWRSKIGYIPQDIYLIDDSVRRNVAFGIEDKDIDDSRIWQVLGQATLDEFVKSLPDGLDTNLGERGTRLSGGQRQRIAIARALYRDPEILVLDEATSALDAATEASITQSVRDLAGTRTILIVAHRISTVRNVDKLFYLSNGTIVAEGTFDQLESSCAEFREVLLGRSEMSAV